MNNNFYKMLFISILLAFVTFITQAQNNYADSLSIQNISFQYLDAKVKLNYEDEQDKFQAKVRLRIEQDKQIWISVTKTNVEGLRILIKPDSIFILDRINEKYRELTFQTLSQDAGILLDFQLLQAILIGNYALNAQPVQTFEDTETFWVLNQMYDRLKAKNYIGKNNQKVAILQLEDNFSQSTLQLHYENFGTYSQKVFPALLTVALQYLDNQTLKPKNTLISWEYQEVEFLETPIEFPFNVSDKYKK